MKSGFLRFLLVLSLNGSLAGLGLLMLPLVVGALAQEGVESRVLGLLGFLELGFSALTAIVVSALPKQRDSFLLCALGAGLAVLGNAASGLIADHLTYLVALRPVAGIGTGLMHAGSLMAVARLSKPSSMYGYVAMAPCFTAILGFTLAPNLLAVVGTSGIFFFQSVMAILNLVTLLAERHHLNAYIAADVAAAGVRPVHAGIAERRPDAPTTILGLAAIFLLGFADAAVWAFVAPLGQVQGISLERMSGVLISAAIVGCFGPLTVARIGDRFDILLQLAIGQFAMIGLSLVMVSGSNEWLYILALNARVFTILFLHPMYNGFAARIDRSGRLVAAAVGFYSIGYAVGPLFAGLLISIERQDFFFLGILSAAACAVSLVLTVMLSRHHQRATPEQ